MKLIRYYGAGALLLGVGAFSLVGRGGEAAPLPSLNAAAAELSVEPVLALAVAPVQDTTPIVAAPPAPRQQTIVRRSNRTRSSSRRFRGRSRNIYPGPIPTPADWAPPEGPVRIALQAGHWKASEAPDELSGLKDNGTTGGGKAEWEVNLEIVKTTAAMLEEKGYAVDILPAVVPPGYRAHLFIAVHADGAADTRASGYRVAAPRQDATGRASRMVSLLEESYGKATGLRKLPDVTRRMENYYAFNFRRYQHALHPMTIAVILETGFLTSAADRRIIVSDPERVARGIVDAVIAFPETSVTAGR
jgi:N-acetylmuramoyl-L-alanine amidase